MKSYRAVLSILVILLFPLILQGQISITDNKVELINVDSADNQTEGNRSIGEIVAQEAGELIGFDNTESIKEGFKSALNSFQIYLGLNLSTQEFVFFRRKGESSFHYSCNSVEVKKGDVCYVEEAGSNIDNNVNQWTFGQDSGSDRAFNYSIAFANEQAFFKGSNFGYRFLYDVAQYNYTSAGTESNNEFTGSYAALKREGELKGYHLYITPLFSYAFTKGPETLSQFLAGIGIGYLNIAGFYRDESIAIIDGINTTSSDKNGTPNIINFDLSGITWTSTFAYEYIYKDFRIATGGRVTGLLLKNDPDGVYQSNQYGAKNRFINNYFVSVQYIFFL